MICPLKFGKYPFEGGQECIGDECAWNGRCHGDMDMARKLGECMAERDELQRAYDEIVDKAAELCRACGFSMVDVNGEVVS